MDGPALHSIEALLRTLFDDDGLRRLVRHQRGGASLSAELPGDDASPAEVAFKVVEVLDRRGRLDSAFFNALAAARPHRRQEIEAVKVRVLGPAEGVVMPSVCDLSRLPRPLSPHFRGRDAELDLLDRSWTDSRTHVLTIVAEGGAGKSALVSRWLTHVSERGWDGAQAVLAWSFGGWSDSETSSAELFTDEALRFLGDGQAHPHATTRAQALRLAALLRSRRTLLILDGIDSLQHGPGAPGHRRGRFRDPLLQALVDALAAGFDGLCILTTRLFPTDLQAWTATTAPVLDLKRLSPRAGTALLRDLGTHGSDEEHHQAVRDLDGNAFALTLLGTFIHNAKKGDLRRRDELDLIHAAQRVAGAEVQRLLDAYDNWFDAAACRLERDILRVVGLFDRPADGPAVAALRQAPAISGLTESLLQASEDDWQWALSSLRRSGLMIEPPTADPDSLNAHALVRAGFGERLRTSNPAAWRTAHLRLYEHYLSAASWQPNTLSEMMPLLHAVHHGCQAGRRKEAFEQVYLWRIQRGGEGFLWSRLGAFSVELSALGRFFDRRWDRPAADLEPTAQARVLSDTGFALYALTRFGPAQRVLEAGLAHYEGLQDWNNAAKVACSLSNLAQTLGQLRQAIHWGRVAVQFAHQGGAVPRRINAITILADALHQAGLDDELASLFQEAEGLQIQHQHEHPLLHGKAGYRYCDLLLGRAEWLVEETVDLAHIPAKPAVRAALVQICREVLARAAYSLAVAAPGDGPVAQALDLLASGRAHTLLWLLTQADGDETSAEAYLEQAELELASAIATLRRADRRDQLPRGLLARAALHRLSGAAHADTDLDQAQALAANGPMPLFMCDAHLEQARLRLSRGYPDAARTDLVRAEALVRETAYLRRRRALNTLSGRIDEAVLDERLRLDESWSELPSRDPKTAPDRP
ncbi:hypothetical protein [Haliangium sp.]|uniref:hypothetical protein n=1 Tax=Haliangium sp. TaxID=2663208 RepID=UPI003D0F5DDD